MILLPHTSETKISTCRPCYLLTASVGTSCDKPTQTYGTSDSAKNRQIV